MNLHSCYCCLTRRKLRFLLVLGGVSVLLAMNAGCRSTTPTPITPTLTPNLTPMRERDLSQVVCQESDLPREWVTRDVLTELPNVTYLPEEVVNYYGVVREELGRSNGFHGYGCHIYVYNDEAAAQRAFEMACAYDLPRIIPPEVGEAVCAFGSGTSLQMVYLSFRRGETLVDISADLTEEEVWQIAGAVDSRLR